MTLTRYLRRILPMLMIVGFLAGTSACIFVSEPTGSSRRHVKSGKHKHRHCHNKRKRHKKRKKHKKFKKHKRSKKVCHKHPHRHPHH